MTYGVRGNLSSAAGGIGVAAAAPCEGLGGFPPATVRGTSRSPWFEDFGKLHALVRDHLGSVRAEVSVGSDGSAEVRRADYWPFGEEITTTLDPSEGHRFTAHWREYRGEVKGASVLEGLDFMHAREYDWRTARFTAPDPAAAGWNAYAYVLGNPVNFVDPRGLREVLPNGPEDLPVNVFMAGTTETTWERLWTTIPGVPELGLDPRPEYQKVADPYEENLGGGLGAAIDSQLDSGREPGADLTLEQRRQLELAAAIAGVTTSWENRWLRPFFLRYRRFLSDPVLPYGENPAHHGIVGNALWLLDHWFGLGPGGSSCVGWSVGLYRFLEPLNNRNARARLLSGWNPLPHTVVVLEVRRSLGWTRVYWLDAYAGTTTRVFPESRFLMESEP